MAFLLSFCVRASVRPCVCPHAGVPPDPLAQARASAKTCAPSGRAFAAFCPSLDKGGRDTVLHVVLGVACSAHMFASLRYSLSCSRSARRSTQTTASISCLCADQSGAFLFPQFVVSVRAAQAVDWRLPAPHGRCPMAVQWRLVNTDGEWRVIEKSFPAGHLQRSPAESIRSCYRGPLVSGGFGF
jgi:hypothetical protein